MISVLMEMILDPNRGRGLGRRRSTSLRTSLRESGDDELMMRWVLSSLNSTNW